MSVLIIDPREIQALWSQTYDDAVSNEKGDNLYIGPNDDRGVPRQSVRYGWTKKCSPSTCSSSTGQGQHMATPLRTPLRTRATVRYFRGATQRWCWREVPSSHKERFVPAVLPSNLFLMRGGGGLTPIHDPTGSTRSSRHAMSCAVKYTSDSEHTMVGLVPQLQWLGRFLSCNGWIDSPFTMVG